MAIRRKRQLIGRGMGGNRTEKFGKLRRMLQAGGNGTMARAAQRGGGGNQSQAASAESSEEMDTGSRSVEEEARKSESMFRKPAASV